MPYPITINGKTYTQADFEPYAYADTFPSITQDIADVAGSVVGAVGTAQQLAAVMQAGPVANVQRRGRSLTGTVSVDPLDASPVLPTKGQFYKPGITLDGTFGRAATATYFDGAGILRTASSGALRYDTNPTTGEHHGALLEAARTNTLTYSAEFENAAWVKGSATITANAATAPDNTVTADKFVPDSALIGFLTNSLTIASGSTYTISVFAKAAELSSFQMLLPSTFFSAGGSRIATFDLTAKTASVTGLTGTEASAAIKQLQNGWFRCSITVTASAAGTVTPQVVRSVAAGDGTSGLHVWGAQSEVGFTATAYIPTVAAAVARPADTLILAGGDWFNPLEGTFFYEFQSNGGASETQIVGGISNTAAPSFNNVIYTQLASTGAAQTVIRSGGATLATLASTISGGKAALHRVAYAYKAGDHAMSADGAAAVTSAVAIPTGMDRWVLGSAPWSVGASALNGGLLDARYVPRRLSNAILQRMTA